MKLCDSEKGIRRLVAAVLLRAIDDYQCCCSMRGAVYQHDANYLRHKRELDQFLDDGLSWAYCELLDVPHEQLEARFSRIWRGSALQQYQQQQEQAAREQEQQQAQRQPKKRVSADEAAARRRWKNYYRGKGATK